MKYPAFILMFMLMATVCRSQTTEEVRQKYEAAVKAIDVVSYEVQRIDTFTSGDVWNNRGRSIIRREDDNKLFGFAFYGKRSDIETASLYNGNTFFEINDAKNKYTATASPSQGVLGSPGGQMVVTELIKPEDKYIGIEHSANSKAYVLKYSYPDKPEHDVKDVYKLIHLDPKTFLPTKVASYLTVLDKKQVNIKVLSNVALNAKANTKELSNQDFLASYTQEIRDNTDHLSELLGQQASPFELKSFDNQTVSLESLKGKMVLLDFWEVWCGPCVQAMPKLQSISEKYKKDGLVVLGITHEANSIESAKKLLQRKNANFTNLIGNESTKSNYKVLGVPEYVLIDETGKIIFASTGYDEKLEKLLREKYKH